MSAGKLIVTRVIQYEGTPEDVARHLEATLLSKQRVVRPGDTVPGIGLVMAGQRAPLVTISLLDEHEG